MGADEAALRGYGHAGGCRTDTVILREIHIQVKQEDINRLKLKIMVKDLVFTQQENGRYTSEFTTTGVRSVVQLNRQGAGNIIVYVRVSGMEEYGASPIFYDVSKDFMFELNLAGGLDVKVESFTEVLSGKLLEEE